MSDDIVIRMEGLWKHYGLPLPGFVRRGQHWLRSLRNGRNPKPALSHAEGSTIENSQYDGGPWALRDLNLEVKRGETLGIIGRNGAGKSTLLKILAGVTPPTRGKVQVHGRVFPMIELNAGLHPELTGRENVNLLGAVMGLARGRLGVLMPAIEEFCELGAWFDRPVRMYSSGMLARLGFGVALRVNANILLIDEILAVGDIAFRQKCVQWLDERRHQDSTVLLVSHSLNQIERLCDRAMYLDQGVLRFVGSVKDTCSHYYESVNDEILQRIRSRSGINPLAFEGSNEMRILEVRLLDAEGREVDRIYHGADLRIVFKVQVNGPVRAPHFTVVIIDSDLNPVGHATTLGRVAHRPNFSVGSNWVECRLQDLQLLKGVFTVDVGMADYQAGYRIGGIANAAQFQVIESVESYHMLTTGHFAFPAAWRLGLSDLESWVIANDGVVHGVGYAQI